MTSFLELRGRQKSSQESSLRTSSVLLNASNRGQMRSYIVKFTMRGRKSSFLKINTSTEQEWVTTIQ